MTGKLESSSTLQERVDRKEYGMGATHPGGRRHRPQGRRHSDSEDTSPPLEISILYVRIESSSWNPMARQIEVEVKEGGVRFLRDMSVAGSDSFIRSLHRPAADTKSQVTTLSDGHWLRIRSLADVIWRSVPDGDQTEANAMDAGSSRLMITRAGETKLWLASISGTMGNESIDALVKELLEDEDGSRI